MAVDAYGTPWIARYSQKDIYKWSNNRKKWISMGMRRADYIAAGDVNQIYALGKPDKYNGYTIYHL